ncbi:hypothetical protein AMJ71_00200 [candidate division TA06 bacterium SM1_40]|uniref:DUF1015 domain-containing protein n=1 Tax=candidate division TA06 bacterium SM1_40 TaxID=1703773 RepID=A0A0S8JPG6_UNCT6|nr:MAG: hypothetical protein AMJ71_00200 [candidate division TA06 bacterium SM1_40]
MAKIFPFRGIRYDVSKVGDPRLLVTPPYDVISPQDQERFYGRSEYNIVRIIRGKDESGDDEKRNKYQRAGEYFTRWLAEGVLVEDGRPGLYLWDQEYKVRGGTKVRRGFVAMTRIEELGEGVVPHEKTLAKPKQDRLNLMRATQAFFGQIFVLYSDPKKVINGLLGSAAAETSPLADFVFDDGVRQKMWRIEDEDVIGRVTEGMAGQPLFIADGHHRYETALTYRNEMRAQGMKCEGAESFENVMMTFVNMDDEGLSIFPTHRFVCGLEDFDRDTFLSELQEHFWVEPFAGGKGEGAVAAFIRELESRGADGHVFGLYTGGGTYHLFGLRDESYADSFGVADRSREWRRLDVAILHTLVLDRVMGVTPEKVEEHIKYTRDDAEAIAEVDSRKYQLSFLMNATRIGEVKAIAINRERMPQKSTYFYPKVLTGLVACRIYLVE